MSLCDKCITGSLHEGEPSGKVEKIGGVDVYVTFPPDGLYDKTKAILYLSDALGMSFVNAKLLADAYASNGFQVYIPDLLNGDPIPDKYLDINNKFHPGTTFDISVWIAQHNEAATRPNLDPVIAALKAERGITSFGATGYCFGGKYTMNLAQENVIKVGVLSHPSLLQVPADLERLAADSRAAVLFNTCDDDSQFPPATSALADSMFGNGKYAPGYKRAHWDGCMHGFAVRGDLSNPKIKAGQEGAFAEGVAWFKQYL